MPVSKKVVLIDSGHGGFDPGKVGIGHNLEKDINLQIAKKLQAYLEQGGSTVLMTRVNDEALASKKAEDMRERIAIANNYKSDILVSIHQNSYPSENVQGAQVFYFDNQENSKKLALYVQEEIKAFVDPENRREAKSNSNYYMLKKSKTPAIIVECGFLSNPSDTNKLTDDEYQEKIAWAIYKGIIKYFNE
jgi:N-acetylmuramoyl-L-alanine amidase